MSGPKIIDVAATRQRERLRLEVASRQALAALARMEEFMTDCPEMFTKQVPRQIREQLRELQRKAATSESVVEIMGLVESAKSLRFFVQSERTRIEQSAREWRARETTNVKSLNTTIAHLREKIGERLDLAAQLDTAEADSEFLSKAKIVEAVSAALDEARDEMRDVEQSTTIQSLASEWENLVAAGEFHTSELPVLPQSRWRVELERIREELQGNSTVEMKINAIENEPDTEKRQMMLDGLRYESADLLKTARTLAERKEQIGDWHASYASLGMMAPESEGGLNRALQLDDAAYAAFREGVETELESELEARAAEFARRAILSSLEELGYEVRQGMATAWVEDGKIVVAKPQDPIYGVELARLPQGNPGLIKTRVVRTQGAVATTTDEKRRDREQEEAWCSDREAMEKLLEKEGIELSIKAMRHPGEVPVEALTAENESVTKSVQQNRSSASK